jgi:hypothetical protein
MTGVNWKNTSAEARADWGLGAGWGHDQDWFCLIFRVPRLSLPRVAWILKALRLQHRFATRTSPVWPDSAAHLDMTC